MTKQEFEAKWGRSIRVESQMDRIWVADVYLKEDRTLFIQRGFEPEDAISALDRKLTELQTAPIGLSSESPALPPSEHKESDLLGLPQAGDFVSFWQRRDGARSHVGPFPAFVNGICPPEQRGGKQDYTVDVFNGNRYPSQHPIVHFGEAKDQDYITWPRQMSEMLNEINSLKDKLSSLVNEINSLKQDVRNLRGEYDSQCQFQKRENEVVVGRISNLVESAVELRTSIEKIERSFERLDSKNAMVDFNDVTQRLADLGARPQYVIGVDDTKDQATWSIGKVGKDGITRILAMVQEDHVAKRMNIKTFPTWRPRMETSSFGLGLNAQPPAENRPYVPEVHDVVKNIAGHIGEIVHVDLEDVGRIQIRMFNENSLFKRPIDENNAANVSLISRGEPELGDRCEVNDESQGWTNAIFKNKNTHGEYVFSGGHRCSYRSAFRIIAAAQQPVKRDPWDGADWVLCDKNDADCAKFSLDDVVHIGAGMVNVDTDKCKFYKSVEIQQPDTWEERT